MDTLHAHVNPLVIQQTIAAAGQQIVYRPKYSPADAPIEYVFKGSRRSKYRITL